MGVNVILCVHVYASLCVYMCVHRLPKIPPPPPAPLLNLAQYFEAKKGKELLLKHSIHVVQTSFPPFFMILNTCEVDSHDTVTAF